MFVEVDSVLKQFSKCWVKILHLSMFVSYFASSTLMGGTEVDPEIYQGGG